MKSPQTGENWTPEEVALVVADYFDMLTHELLNQPYNKAEHNSRLRQRLTVRSKSAIERKHQNISYVMITLGCPYINGYKPLSNAQGILTEAVQNHLGNHAGQVNALASSPKVVPTASPYAFADVFVDPPTPLGKPFDQQSPCRSRARWTNFVERDASNRELGKLGEKFVVDVERKRLLDAGRDDLAQRVEWVSQTQGDGLGFDVLSYDGNDDSERPIEVKTTGLGVYFPFYVTRNELQVSQTLASRYHLYRVFDFSQKPRVFVLKGDLAQSLRLEATQYRASLINR